MELRFQKVEWNIHTLNLGSPVRLIGDEQRNMKFRQKIGSKAIILILKMFNPPNYLTPQIINYERDYIERMERIFANFTRRINSSSKRRF